MFGKRDKEESKDAQNGSAASTEAERDRIEIASLASRCRNLESSDVRIKAELKAELKRHEDILTAFMLKLGYDAKEVPEQVIPQHIEITKVAKS